MIGNTVDGQTSQGQSSTGGQVSATTISSAAAVHTQAALSVQQPQVSNL